MEENLRKSMSDENQPFELPSGKSYHVFISYATIEPDKQIAQKLYINLTNGGYKCCLHEIDFKAGRFIQDNIAKNVKKSVKVIVILSEHFRNSFWCTIEMNEVVALHMQNRGFAPIILKLDKCEVPELIRPYTYMKLDRELDEQIPGIFAAVNDLEITEYPASIKMNVSFVPIPCINYNQDKPHSPCIWPHICAKFILSDISCNGCCNKSHDFDKESIEKLRKCGFPVERNKSYLLRLYIDKCRKWLTDFPTKSVCGPCFYYNDKGCFTGTDICPFTHICKDWFLGNCRRMNCPFSHDISNQQTSQLLERFGINTNHPDDIVLWQYRERCQVYSEIKAIQLQESTITNDTDSFSHLLKCVLYIIFGAILFKLIYNKFDVLWYC